MGRGRWFDNSKVSPWKLCGYCKLHHIGLTVKQMGIKKCQTKKCHHFVKYENHGYWVQMANRNKAKAEKKSKEKEIAVALENTEV